MELFVVELEMDYSPSKIVGVFSKIDMADAYVRNVIINDEFPGYNEVSVYRFELDDPKSKERVIHFDI